MQDNHMILTEEASMLFQIKVLHLTGWDQIEINLATRLDQAIAKAVYPSPIATMRGKHRYLREKRNFHAASHRLTCRKGARRWEHLGTRPQTGGADLR